MMAMISREIFLAGKISSLARDKEKIGKDKIKVISIKTI